MERHVGMWVRYDRGLKRDVGRHVKECGKAVNQVLEWRGMWLGYDKVLSDVVRAE